MPRGLRLRRCSPIRAGTRTEFGPEGAIEIRDVAETGIERDVHDLGRFGRETRGRRTQTHPHQVLMRRDASQAFERAQEMKWAQPRFPGEADERETRAVLFFDH